MGPKEMSEEEIQQKTVDRLRRSRASHRGWVTKYANEAKTVSGKPPADVSEAELHRLQDLRGLILKTQTEITEKDQKLEELVEDSELEKEIEDAANMTQDIEAAFHQIQLFIDKVIAAKSALVSVTTGVTGSAASPGSSHIKLPKHDLPENTDDFYNANLSFGSLLTCRRKLKQSGKWGRLRFLEKSFNSP